MANYDHGLASKGAGCGPHRSGRRFLGEQVRQARRMACWTQQDLAMEVGIEPYKLSRYERGVDLVPARLLSEMAQVLELQIGFGCPHLRKH